MNDRSTPSPAGARRLLRSLRWCLLALLVAVVTWPALAHAEDRVTIRGNYYRERSTRVLQPTVHVTVDAPDERLTLGAAYVLDAISSASIATGTQAVTGGDNVFTEIRHEAMGTVGSKLGNWSLGGFFRYSTETDYISRSVGASVSRDFLQRSLNLSLAYAYNFDRVFEIIDSTGRRAPWCGGSEVGTCRGEGHGLGTNLLQVHYLSVGYAHALHKTLLLLLGAEGAFARGPQDNPYREELLPGIAAETHPLIRNRLALSSELRWYVPEGRTTFEPQYRFYVDDWGVQGHSIDGRIHFRLTDHLRARVRYRFYIQSEAFFWRDDMMYSDLDIRCTRQAPDACASADPKLDDWHSHTPGIQLTYELDRLARFKGLTWLEGAWIQATYNHVFQTNRYGPARLGSLAFSMAF